MDKVEGCGQSGCLHNIKEDPEERINLASEIQGVLKEMQDKLAEYQATYFDPNRGTQPLAACDAAK